MTSLGAIVSCFFPERLTQKGFEFISGFAAGIMVAASVWSLLIPSIESSSFTGKFTVTEALIGMICGGAFMLAVTKFFPESENRSFGRLFIAITVHNVPEGMAVGFAFAAASGGAVGLAAAVSLAVGIGVQNFPEGMAVSLPARHGYGKKKALFLGIMSGAVEPLAGLIGFFAIGGISALLPYFMSFAAGAMIFASFTDVISDALVSDGSKTGVGAVVGFTLMMLLDNIL